MKAYLKYAGYVLKHKWYVFVECRKLGIPWLGVIHDLSKFLPDEWGPYARTFHAPDGSRRYEPTPEYYRARLFHQRRNKHHWQWWLWVDEEAGDRPPVPLPMPDRYRREMLADWLGAGRSMGKPDVKSWYVANREKILLHPETRIWLENHLGVEASVEEQRQK